jgi:UDP-N-acetylmuramyl pentapeptide synthase
MCQEQAVLTQSLLPHQIAILNPHDPLVWATRKDIQAKVISIEKCAANSIFGEDVIFSRTASRRAREHEKINIKPKYIFPQVYDITFGTAITLAHILGIPKSQAIQNIQANFHLPSGRAGLFQGKSGSSIIDSTYNASPQPMREFLDLLATHPGRTIAILGDMRELGHQSAPEHRSLAPHALQCADLILTVGPQMQKYFPNHKKIHKFLYWWQAQKFLENNPLLLKNTTVLVKGSQNTIYLEEAVASILRDQADRAKLCRQETYWVKIKDAFFASLR